MIRLLGIRPHHSHRWAKSIRVESLAIGEYRCVEGGKVVERQLYVPSVEVDMTEQGARKMRSRGWYVDTPEIRERAIMAEELKHAAAVIEADASIDDDAPHDDDDPFGLITDED